MGGLGKRSLAQMVYKDDSILRSFDKKAWVCLSDDFNFKKILMNMIESLAEKKCDDFSNHTVLVDKLRVEPRDKNYLLVLDDLWNEDAEDWEKLKGFLNVGAQGSKILVTTRSNVVASVVRDVAPP
ncbi:putative disease resistance protein RGA3 [Papaver somniferum]|uniref:putative disease resistance protein RGA3 n=1 Tax=Papaver somniferum TaxID=3469 RepID=UPI000E6F77ED|nr:putative disease resistance protein RGA3 [Papaver somniferum]